MSSNFDNIRKISTCVEQDTLVGNTKYFSHVYYVQRNPYGESAMWVASIEEFLHKLNNPDDYIDAPNKTDTRVFTSLSDAEEYHNQQLIEEEQKHG
tara:strand:+ start:64 stop:351 length:288 start_codon:yes stop_codon:yes gene_type:complete